MITLTRKDTNAVLELPDHLRWTDEHDWSPLAQASPQYSLGGAVIVQQGTMLAGRPVTLGMKITITGWRAPRSRLCMIGQRYRSWR